MRYSPHFDCEECGAIARELRISLRMDQEEMRRRLGETADSSGRDLDSMRDAWLATVSRMPPDEMRTVLQAHYPRTAEARRKMIEHQAVSEHSVHALVWWSGIEVPWFTGYSPDSK